MTRVVLVPVVAVSVMVACTSDRPLPPTSPHISAAISDGAHGANPNFFFLPPMVQSPTTSGVFNPNLAPVVTICQVASDACVGGTTFSPGPVPLDRGAQQYHVNWHTDPTTVNLSATYRIIVSVNGQELGFADVQPVSNGGQLKKLDTGELIGLVDGRTLPIKVRIEQGALCFAQAVLRPDCTEVTVGAAAQDVITGTGRAAIHFDAGSFSQPVDLVIAKIETGGDFGVPCHITNLAQFDDCYSITISPSTVPLLLAARAEICLNGLNDESPGAFASDHRFLVKSEPGVAGVVQLTEAHHSLITCPGYAKFTLGARSPGRVWDLASAGWRLLRGLVEPEPLHAATAASLVIDEGLGGVVPPGSPAFSHFGWVIPKTLSIFAGGVTAVAGSTVEPDPTVCVKTTHPMTAGVAASVTFTVATGGGLVLPPAGDATTSATVPTDESGCASIPWQMGAAGTNTLTASTPFAEPPTVTFTANATP